MSSKGSAIDDGSSHHENYDSARLGSVVYMCIVGTCGIIANSLVIFVFWKHSKLRTAANLFILNLALCDLMLSILDNVFSITSTLHGRWLFGRAGCVTYGFFHYFLICCTVSTLAAISVDRFFFITRPSQARTAQMITPRKAVAMLAIIYFYTLMFTFPPCIGWNNFEVEESFYSGCYINYADQRASSIAYSIIAPFFLFLVPLTIMIFCYARIFAVVRRSTQRTINRPFGAQSLKRYPLLKRTHIQTAKIIVVVILFSMIVWVPYVVVSFVKAANGKVNPLLSHITVLVAKSCVVYNVLIYAVLNRKLKASILDVICCGKQNFRMVGSPSSGNSLQRNRNSRFLSQREVPSDIAESLKNRASTLSVQEGNGNVHDQYTDNISPSQLTQLRNGVLKSIDHVDGRESGKVVGKKEVDVVRNGDKVQVGEPSGFSETRMVVATQERDSKILGLSDARSSDRGTNRFLARLETDTLPEIAPQDTHLKPEAISNASSLSRNETPRVDCKVDTPLCNSSSSNRQLNRLHHMYSSKSSKHARLQNLSSPSQLYKKGARPTSAQRVTGHIASDSRTSRAGVSSGTESDVSTRASHRPATTQRPKKRRAADRTNSTHTSERRKSSSYINYGRKDSVDPLRTSPKELWEIQNYWKRMSLCLDDIDVDDVTREIQLV
ncbi:melanopsin-B-like [Acropora millepora]|uniref:melanopsin-B-like n=1 Tax=Acropora millepora TaxID=45264 RepID=UPI001CF489FC|nr:melanopsin-B-like [Acropora millepora]